MVESLNMKWSNMAASPFLMAMLTDGFSCLFFSAFSSRSGRKSTFVALPSNEGIWESGNAYLGGFLYHNSFNAQASDIGKSGTWDQRPSKWEDVFFLFSDWSTNVLDMKYEVCFFSNSRLFSSKFNWKKNTSWTSLHSSKGVENQTSAPSTRWALSLVIWPCKWVTGVITLTSRAITGFWGPPFTTVVKKNRRDKNHLPKWPNFTAAKFGSHSDPWIAVEDMWSQKDHKNAQPISRHIWIAFCE